MTHNSKPKRNRNTKLSQKNITWPALAALTLSACGGGASNRPPIAATFSEVTVDEDSSGNALGITAPTDEDTNDTLSINVDEVPSGGTITTSAGIVVEQGSTLTVSELTGLVFTPDADANSDLSEIGTFSYTVSDDKGGTDSSSVTITVTPVADAPTITASDNISVEENDAAVISGFGNDVDGDTLTYSITGGADQDLFTIDSATGALSFKNKPDFETPSDSDGDNIYTVEVTVDDGTGNTVSQTIQVTVTDVVTMISIDSTSINENNDGAIVGTLSSVIDDTSATDTFTYTLSGTDEDSFEVVDGQLKLKDSVTANYETKNSYSVTVTATDTGGLTTSQSFTVTVNDLNDDPTVANEITDQSVNEDSALSFVVPTNTFNDEDGDTLTYTATLSDDSALPSWLSFDATTQTFSGTPLNDDVGSISVKVTATDAADVTISDTFTLTVVNTNDAPTAIALSATAIDENSAGAIVGNLTTTDVDVGDSHTYTLSGTDAALFEVVNGQLKLKGSADYETKNSYSVTVTSADAADAVFAQSFTITVTDVNEAPTAIALSATAIDENSAGATVGNLTTTDVDDSDVHTYSLSGDDADSFEVVDGQLKLKSTVTADYETQTSYSVTVTATDTGGLTTSQSFTVTVNNLNDNDPVITSESSINMEENSNSVITVTATDADGDSLTYSITGGDDSGLFTIDSTTGALTLQAKTDGLTTTDSTLPVSLTNMVDNGDGTYTADIEVHPSVTSFAALAGVTIWFSFDSSEMSFTDGDVIITADGLLDQVTTLSDGRIKLLWADSTNTLEAGKIGTITFTPTSGATDPAITIETQLTGGDKDSIDATKSTTDTSIYNFTIVRTNVDFENPVDSDTDNVYKVTIQVSDGENTASQDIEVTVTDVAESSKPSSANINDDNNPITDDNDDTPPDIDLPDWSLFVAGFNLGSIILPETVTVMEDSTLPDLSDLIGLIGDQSESLALDFDHIDSGDPVIASVKPVITDWISHTDPFLENDWNPIIEELFYTTEMG